MSIFDLQVRALMRWWVYPIAFILNSPITLGIKNLIKDKLQRKFLILSDSKRLNILGWFPTTQQHFCYSIILLNILSRSVVTYIVICVTYECKHRTTQFLLLWNKNLSAIALLFFPNGSIYSLVPKWTQNLLLFFLCLNFWYFN